jgi:hypothetical protein
MNEMFCVGTLTYLRKRISAIPWVKTDMFGSDHGENTSLNPCKDSCNDMLHELIDFKDPNMLSCLKYHLTENADRHVTPYHKYLGLQV